LTRRRDPSWDTCRLSEIIARLDGGVSVRASDSPCDNGHPGVLKVSAVYDGRFFPEENKAVLNGQRPATDLAIEPGDLLISRANTPDLVGACGIARTAHANLYPPDKLWKVRLADPDRDSVEWLALVLCSPDVRTELRNRASGTGRAMKNISKEAFLAIPVRRPPRDAQDAIVRVLKPFADLDELLDRLISAKGRLRDGLAQALLTGRRRLPAFAGEEWEEVKLGDLLERVDRHVQWSDDAMYRLVSVRRRSGGFFDRGSKRGREILTKTMKTTKAGDFVIARMQVLHGAMTVTPPEFDGANVYDSYLTFVPRDPRRLRMPFLGWLSTRPNMYYMAFRSSYGVAIEKMTFHLPWFLDESITVPKSIDEQSAIADILDEATREIDALTRLREAVAKQKRGLMQQLLTGRLRVPEVSDA